MGIFDLYKKITTDPDELAQGKINELEKGVNKYFKDNLEYFEKDKQHYSEEIKKYPKSENDKELLGSVVKEIEKIKGVETKYLKLKEKLKHSPKERIDIAQDWYDYNQALSHDIHCRQLLMVDSYGNNLQKFQDDVKESRITMEEIEKRFDKLSKE